jgi:hypothetical protein
VATVNTYVAAVNCFLGFAHRVGFTRFNAAPLIKLKKAPRQLAQRIMGELEVRMLIRAAKPGRDRLLLEVAYFGALRVSELVSLTWSQVIRRDSGEAQLSIIGKGDKAREVLIPAAIAAPLLASHGDAPAGAPVFASVRRPGQPLTERAVNYIVRIRHYGLFANGNRAANIARLRDLLRVPTILQVAAEETTSDDQRQLPCPCPRVSAARAAISSAPSASAETADAAPDANTSARRCGAQLECAGLFIKSLSTSVQVCSAQKYDVESRAAV